MDKYLVIAKHTMNDSVMFLAANSLTQARKELPRYSDSTGYTTLWKSRWATKEDVKKYPKEFAMAKLKGFEFKGVTR